MEAALFIAAVILVVFAREMLVRWWHQRAWRREWRKRERELKSELKK